MWVFARVRINTGNAGDGDVGDQGLETAICQFGAKKLDEKSGL